MDTPKISKLLRLMKLLTGNVSRTIDTIRKAGFVVNKLYGNVYAMGKVARGLTDFKKLIYFTDEEAYLAADVKVVAYVRSCGIIDPGTISRRERCE